MLESSESIKEEGVFTAVSGKLGKPFSLSALLSQGDAGAAAAGAVCVFPRGLCHVPASHQCSGRTDASLSYDAILCDTADWQNRALGGCSKWLDLQF